MANTIKLGTDSNWAVKENNLLAYNDENNIFKPIDFDFTRDSGATRVNEQGLIENVPSGVPRIDFSDGKGSLLLEPQSRNLIPYSEDFLFWANGNSTLTSGVLSPTGDTNAFNVLAWVGSSNRIELAVTGLSTSTEYSLSCFVKKEGTDDTARLDFDATEGRNGVQFTFSTESLTNANGTTSNRKVVSYGGGWYRISFNFTTDISRTSPTVQINRGNVSKSANYFGAQLEQQSYATSYIPTSGATATREAETCNNAGNSTVFNDSEGVLYVEALLKDTGTFKTAARITVTDTSTTDGLWIYFRSDNKIQSVLRVGGVDQVTILSNTQTTDEYYKVAFKFKQNDFALWVNGTEVDTNTSGNTFSADTLSKLGFVLSTSTNPFIGNVKDLRVYNQALTDAELISLTS